MMNIGGECELFNRVCIGCGECDRCDLDPDKICDNCGKCLETDTDFTSIQIDKIYASQEDYDKDNK